MYWHTKLIIFLIIASIGGSILYNFRTEIKNLSFLGKKPKANIESASNSSVSSSSARRKSIRPAINRNDPPPQFNEKLQKAVDLFEKDDLINSRKITENILLDPNLELYSKYWMKAAELLSQINTIFIFTDAPCPEKQTYLIKRGDSLVKIARQFNATVAMIQKSNGLDETNPMIYPDQTFRIFFADWTIKVVKSKFLLLVKNGDKIIKVYRIGIGRQDRTPVGTFEIDLKDFEPDWWRPGKVVKFGDPENVLGTRWMSLLPTGETSKTLKGYGIHGTWQPESIGTAASQGCVRMVNENVEELFDIVPLNTQVEIVD